MKIYKCQGQYYNTVKKKIYLLSVVLGLLIIAYMYYSVTQAGADLIAFYIGALAVILGGAASLFSLLKKAKRIFATYELMVEDDSISRKQHGLEDLKLNRQEITEIQVTKKDLVLRTKETNRFLAIPRGLEGFSEVEELLATWVPIKPYKINTKDLVAPSLEIFVMKLLLPLEAFLIIFTAIQDKTDHVFIFGSITLAIAVILLYILKRYPSLWQKYKTKIIFYLILGVFTGLGLFTQYK